MKKLNIRDIDPKGKRVLVRVDFNVPQDKKTRAILIAVSILSILCTAAFTANIRIDRTSKLVLKRLSTVMNSKKKCTIAIADELFGHEHFKTEMFYAQRYLTKKAHDVMPTDSMIESYAFDGNNVSHYVERLKGKYGSKINPDSLNIYKYRLSEENSRIAIITGLTKRKDTVQIYVYKPDSSIETIYINGKSVDQDTL